MTAGFHRIARDGAVIADFMCGGGGSSLGIHRFLEEQQIPVKRFVAINHDPKAIVTHNDNFPWVTHFCQDVSHVDLHEAFPDGYCDFAWASPTCTQHSRARGGRPINDQLRNAPWQLLTISTEIYVARWAIENVPEFLDWAPVDSKGRKILSRKGEVFQAWKAAMEAVGYRFEWRITNAADFGAATTRERFLALLTRKGKIYWAIPTHSETGDGDLFNGDKKKWTGAGEFLDLSLPTKPVTGRRVPLAAPTLARGWYGMKQLWPASAVRVFSPDIRDAAAEGLAYSVAALPKAKRELRAVGRKNLTPAKMAKRRKALKTRIKRLTVAIPRFEDLLAQVSEYLAEAPSPSRGELHPFLLTLRGTSDSAVRSSTSALDEPANGIVAGGGHLALAAPRIEPLVGGNRAHNVPRNSSQPSGGITTSGGLFLVCPAAEPIVLGQHGGGVARPASKPSSTITQGGAASVFTAEAEELIVARYGDKRGKPRASRKKSQPLGSPTTTQARFGLVQPLIQAYYGAKGDVPRASRTPEQPVGTQTRENRFGILSPCLVQTNHTGDVHRKPRTPAQPLSEMTTRNGIGVIQGYLENAEIDIGALDVSLRERLLIGEDGNLYIARLHLRMLDATREISRLMGFPAEYKWPKQKSLVTKFSGNAVHSDWAYAHVKAFLADWSPTQTQEGATAA